MDTKPVLVRPRFASDLDRQASLWIARLCAFFPEALAQINDGVYVEELRTMVGLSPSEGKLAKRELRVLLRARAQQFVAQPRRKKTILERNVGMVGKLLALDELQEEIVMFAAMSEEHNLLQDVMERICAKSNDSVVKLLSVVLAANEMDVRNALRPNGPLIQTRIVRIEQYGVGQCTRVELPENLYSALFGAADDIGTLMRSFLEESPGASLDADDFTHLTRETALLTAYLEEASRSRVCGINILIHGMPGAGKTEYARWLATHLQRRLYQVRASDDQDAPISGLDRLAFFQLSQAFLRNSSAFMLFDEIEDVFPRGEERFEKYARARRVSAGKMFMNRLLENNPVPTIWISNEVGHMDKAYLRRFDFSFEMGVPPITARRRILGKHLGLHGVSEDSISRLAHHEQLSPAQIEKAAKILKMSGDRLEDRDATLSFVIENSMALLEQAKAEPTLDLEGCRYQLDFLNTDCALGALVEQLKHATNPAGTLCLYGPPGTGKTALAHYIASKLGLLLLVRRASNIFGPFLGQTEQNIAAMFSQASKERAVLLLDEADSFLRDRKSASYSWEVTIVNEMLTQMERFPGLFICSTNLMQQLDEASLRRFALKIRFDYLQPEQRWRLFLDQAKKFHRSHDAEYRAALNQLNNLTPGDFATVRRQAALLSVTLTAEELLNRLKQECKSKGGSETRQIGFILNQ